MIISPDNPICLKVGCIRLYHKENGDEGKNGVRIMKKGIGIAIVGGVAIFGYAIYRYFKKQINLLYDFEWKAIGLKLDEITGNLIKGAVTFRFTNKADLEIKVTKFYLDLYFNGEYVGYIEDSREFVIPSRGYNDIEFSFSINPQLFLRNVVDILAFLTNKKDGVIGLKGYVTAKSGFVKTTVKINCDCSVKDMDCSC